MVFSRELPHSFAEALRVCRLILSSNLDLVRNNLVETEAEQLVIGAHRLASGQKMSRTDFFTRMQDGYPESSGSRLLVLAGQRSEGLLLQHLLGWQTFLSHDYEVNSSTLIPRPETEVLVQEAIRALSSIRAGDRIGPAIGFEIGVGSGVISIELLSAFSSLKMIASEISLKAIQLAQRNAVSILGSSDRLEIAQAPSPSDVLSVFSGRKADFLISNPPYLDRTQQDETESGVCKHEPAPALFPEGEPLHFYREIASGAGALLNPGGKIFLEIASERAEQTVRLFESHWDVQLVPDLTGRPRVLIAGTR
jgi:release factor glutamine methyltransferase